MFSNHFPLIKKESKLYGMITFSIFHYVINYTREYGIQLPAITARSCFAITRETQRIDLMQYPSGMKWQQSEFPSPLLLHLLNYKLDNWLYLSFFSPKNCLEFSSQLIKVLAVTAFQT